MRKFLTLVFIGILLLLNYNFIQGSYSSFQKLSEINQEQVKVEELEFKNAQLKEELKSRDSTYFLEQEARDRLGYARPGETTIVVDSSEIAVAGQKSVEKQKSNLQSWLDLVTN
jgi:cell division protein FtsB